MQTIKIYPKEREAQPRGGAGGAFLTYPDVLGPLLDGEILASAIAFLSCQEARGCSLATSPSSCHPHTHESRARVEKPCKLVVALWKVRV